MDKHSDPIETIIEFAAKSGAEPFWVNNAKDALKKLKTELNNNLFSEPVCWANINSSGQFFNIRIPKNPYIKNLISLHVKIKDVEQIMSSFSEHKQS